MTEDDIKAAEKRGYQRGYTAGRRKREEKRAAERVRRERQAMLDRIYLALLPVYISEPIAVDGKEITKLSAKVGLASEMANYALKRRPIA